MFRKRLSPGYSLDVSHDIGQTDMAQLHVLGAVI